MMVSYGQNHEDVLLDRLFPRDYRGFYIDVGANHPVHNSVTKHFYDLRWSGINVEPSAAYEVLAASRPRDVNLRLAISDHDGFADLHELAAATTSSSLAPAANVTGGVVRRVATRTLASICREHVGDRTIDFLSVDVEGHEAAVLRGADWSRWRPRVVLMEAVHPETRAPEHAEWEPTLVKAAYQFATFDGLNRFYVREEDLALAELLRTPVSIFDEFLSRTQLVGRQSEWLDADPSPEQLEELGFFYDGHYRLRLSVYLRLNAQRSCPRMWALLRRAKQLFRRKSA